LGNREVYDWLQQNKTPLLLEIPFDREIARIYSEGGLLVEEKPAYQIQFKKS
jgi:MinD superfamily P-loop ATPase